MSSKIKTLDEILADMGHPHSASTTKTVQIPPKIQKTSLKSPKNPTPPTHPSTKTTQTIKSSTTDVVSKLAQILNGVNPEPLVTNDKKINRLRWLAFYYLSRRELSQHELRQKLLAKNQDPTDVENLLIEFAEKGYQSDERCAHMLVRESIRKGRGKQHIKQSLKHAKLDTSFDVEQLLSEIDKDVVDGTILEDDCTIDWLKLAVEARCKKYGDTIPLTPKEKARQLRFLQYRGFDYDVCFAALKKTLADFDD